MQGAYVFAPQLMQAHYKWYGTYGALSVFSRRLARRPRSSSGSHDRGPKVRTTPRSCNAVRKLCFGYSLFSPRLIRKVDSIDQLNAWSARKRTIVNPNGSTASSLFLTFSRKTYVTVAVHRSRFTSLWSAGFVNTFSNSIRAEYGDCRRSSRMTFLTSTSTNGRPESRA